MGDLNVKIVSSKAQLNSFTKYLLKDVQALEKMLEGGWFNETPIHIGAEQEICLLDTHYKPAPVAMELLKHLSDDFTTELAKFNIEGNLDPLEFSKDCFSRLETNINRSLVELREVANKQDVDFVLTGILPTIRKFDLALENLTPLKRYHALIKAITKLRGKIYELRITGIDELNIKHDSAMLEACNTSFQVHLQICPDEFVCKYNISQVLAAPVLAIASNSPLLFGKRLWSETRVALFQQSIDTRVTSEHLRDRSPRVTFGNKWLENSILELYKEDIVRFRVMLMTDIKDDVLKQMEEGITPKLSALTIHNSTVYRWNRPCYGISPNGKPHLRIENRVLPAGPSVVDEVANAAFWLGLMTSFESTCKDVTQKMDFSDAKANFLAASRIGLDSEISWINGKKIGISELIKKELLPLAKEGLNLRKVNKADIDRYMEVIEERNQSRKNGTQWILGSYAKLLKETTREESTVAITAAMVQNQKKGIPIHQWDLASIDSIHEYRPTGILVEEFMTTDLFTVHQDDIPELVADIMDWQKIRYTPVEDDKGTLIGLISSRKLLRFFCQNNKLGVKQNKSVKDLMIKNPLTISPESTITDAMHLLQKNKIGCLPVVKKHKLVGIITEENFLSITASLLNSLSRKNSTKK